MAEPSTFRGTLDFFGKLGIFDVILPFLLVFTVVFAILEKTKVFGTEKVGDQEVTKKNLNAMTAFVIAFFTIASSKLVEMITEISANVVILLLASIFLLLLLGSFHKQTAEGFFLEGGTRAMFVVVMTIGLALIFLNAIETGGKTWLMWVIDWIRDFATNTAVAAVLLLLIVVGLLLYITGGFTNKKPAGEKK